MKTTIQNLLNSNPAFALLLIFLLAGLVFVVGTVADNMVDNFCRQAPTVVITGQAVTPSIISTNATPTPAAQSTADIVENATRSAVAIEAEIEALEERIATLDQVEAGLEWHSPFEKPPAWQVVEVLIVAKYVYDPERDVWIALEDDPQWQLWRPAQQ